VELRADGNLVLLDWISAGRLESGERWAFDQCSSRIEVLREGRMEFLDALLLDAQHGSLPARMRRYNTLATLVFCGPRLQAGAGALHDAVAKREPGAADGILWGASRFGMDGVVLRWAAVDVESLGRAIKSALSFVAEMLGDDPWARRW
jgi:urease accessory protein